MGPRCRGGPDYLGDSSVIVESVGSGSPNQPQSWQSDHLSKGNGGRSPAGVVYRPLWIRRVEWHSGPTLIQKVNGEAGNRFDDASNKARQFAAEAEELHKAGKHAESVAKAQEAKKLLGI